MGILTTLLIWAASTLLLEIFGPKPQFEDARPATLGDFNFPTASESRKNPIIVGKVRLKAPNVVWAGDFEARPVSENRKTGLFSSTDVVIAYEYYVGLQLALCRGEIDGVTRIWSDDDELWVGDVTADGTVISIDLPDFYGGEDGPNAGGGVVGDFVFYSGSAGQSADPYLAAFQSSYNGTPITAPAYVGTAYFAVRKAYVGTAPRLRAWSFEAYRYPNTLGLSGGNERIGDDANPVCWLYEIYTNTEWGLRKTAADFELAEWQAAGDQVFAEGLGISLIVESATTALDAAKEVLRVIDAVIYENPQTGKLRIKLVRQFSDVEIAALPVLDESNCELESYKRAHFDETINEIIVPFVDRHQLYTERVARAQDGANIRITGQSRVSTIKFVGLSDRAVAQRLADRELQAQTLPLATGTLLANRVQWGINPGEGFVLRNSDRNITDTVCRVTQVRPGTPEDRRIKIDWAEDNFALVDTGLVDPPDTGFEPPATTPVDVVRAKLFELPYSIAPGNLPTLGVAATRDGGLQTSYLAIYDPAGGTAYVDGAVNQIFTPSGTTTTALDAVVLDAENYLDSVVVGALQDASPADIALLAASTVTAGEETPTAVLIGDELCWFESASDNGDGTVTLSNLHRGWIDTIPAEHSVGTLVYFIGQGIGRVTDGEFVADVGDTITVKLLTRTARGELAEVDATQFSHTWQNRLNLPIPPGDPRLNDRRITDDSWTSTTGALSFDLNSRNRITQPLDTDQPDTGISAGGSTFYKITVRRTDTSAVVALLDGITAGPGGAAQANITGYIPSSVVSDNITPDTLGYSLEIVGSRAGVGESIDTWTRDFTAFGFGIDFGNDFGGIKLGPIAKQGDPPIIPTPIPGREANTVSFTFEGVPGTSDVFDVTVRYAPYTDAAGAVDATVQVSSSGASTLSDLASELFSLLSGITDPNDYWQNDVSISILNNTVTISSFFGYLNASLVTNGFVGGTAELYDARIASTASTPELVVLDLYEREEDDRLVFAPDSGDEYDDVPGFTVPDFAYRVDIERAKELYGDDWRTRWNQNLQQFFTTVSIQGAGNGTRGFWVTLAILDQWDTTAESVGWSIGAGSGAVDQNGATRSRQAQVTLKIGESSLNTFAWDDGWTGPPNGYRLIAQTTRAGSRAYPAGRPQWTEATFSGDRADLVAGMVFEILVTPLDELDNVVGPEVLLAGYTVQASDLTDDPYYLDPIYEGLQADVSAPYTSELTTQSRPESSPHTDGRSRAVYSLIVKGDFATNTTFPYAMRARAGYGTFLNITES